MIDKLNLGEIGSIDLNRLSKNLKKIEEKINEVVGIISIDDDKTENKKYYFNQITKALEKTGFPLELRVRNKLQEIGFENSHFAFEDRDENGYIKMRELDTISNIPILDKRNYIVNCDGIHLDASLTMIGSIKKWKSFTIYFYEQNIENYLLPSFPIFLFDKINFIDFFNYGYKQLNGQILEQYLKIFNIPFSFNLRMLDAKMIDQDDGPIFRQTNELARACEFFLDNSINEFPSHILIRGYFPVILTDANIVKISTDLKSEYEHVNQFIYLSGLQYPYKTPLVSKHKFYFPTYFPVLITNFNGIDESMELIKNIRNNIQIDIENIWNNIQIDNENRQKIINNIRDEHRYYRQFVEDYQREKSKRNL